MEIPGAGAWTFETAEIAEGFDRHVREQLPWYELATNLVAHVARHYVPEDGVVVDLGASTGNVGRSIAETLTERNASLIAVDRAESMRNEYRAPGQFVVADLRDYTPPICDFAVAFLCLMFLPVTARKVLIQRVYDSLRPGGAFLMFDRMEALQGYPATILWRMTLAGKVAAGVDPREIVAKELSLAGIQRPLSMREVPPTAIEVFRFGDFAGFLVTRDA